MTDTAVMDPAVEQEKQESFEDWLQELDKDSEDPVAPEGIIDAGTTLYEIKRMEAAKTRLDNERVITIAKRTEEVDLHYGPKLQRLQERIDRSTQFLRSFVEISVKENPKFKCITPYGTAYFRVAQPKFEWDDKKTIAYLKANGQGELVKATESYDKRAVKESLRIVVDGGELTLVNDETGEVFDGATATAGKTSFIIKPKG